MKIQAKITLASLTLLSVAPLHAAAVVYEPFDYAVTTLAGASGATEVGLDGTWAANSTAVSTGSLAFGVLETTGGKFGQTSNSQNRFAGARTVSASALAGNGLLDDGAELWFSVQMGYGTGGNLTNATLAFALANNAFTGTNFGYQIADDGGAGTIGSGIGAVLGRTTTNGHIRAAQFQDPSFGTGFNGMVYGTDEAGAILAEGEHTLVIGKFTWGAGSDTLDLYFPDTALNLGTVQSTLTVNVNQSEFDTITMQRGDAVVLDEIRFGATLADVTPIPEPTSLSLIGLAGLGLLRRRRK